MKLVYTAATQRGYVDNGAARGAFTQTLTVSFACEMFWYEPAAGAMFYANGYARTDLTDAQRAEVAALIPTITI